MLKISDDKCTGCTLCGSVCPTGAISFEIRNGFRYPQVNQQKCVNCEICVKKCPALNKETSSNSYPKVYAAWSRNTEQRSKCTSGGICYELSKYVLEHGGNVAGVAWTSDFKNAEYRLIKSLVELPSITQTKYFQPLMSNIYNDVREALKLGKQVLFIGSACTNAAVRQFVGKDLSDNLICCDFICRGYTSQQYHQKRIEDLEEKYKSAVKSVQYKNKSRGWNNFGTYFEFQNGESYYVSRNDDPYEIMFKNDDYNTRPSCFECKYRENPRLCDITVGDFWGVKNIDDDIKKNGVSAVMIYSERGLKLFESIADQIEFQERNLWDVSEGNRALLNQLYKREGAGSFFEDLKAKPLSYVHKKYGKKNIKGSKFKKIKKAVYLLLNCSLYQLVYYNYMCPWVVRKKHCYLIPYRGSKIQIDKNGKLVLNSSLRLNVHKHKHSREESYLHIYCGGKFEVNGTVEIAAGNTVDVLTNAELIMGKTETNYNTVIVCSNKIKIGDGIGIGRNVTIYDSNYHKTGISKNTGGKPLIIEDHVWLCTGVTIAKGLKIGAGAICGLNSMITKNVKSRHMVLGNPAEDVMSDVEW